jgi:hypothetical protein
MTILDKAKTTASRALDQAKRGVGAGRARMDETRARRQHRKLLQQVGEACYAEHTGEGAHEAVVRALDVVDKHLHAPSARRVSGRP